MGKRTKSNEILSDDSIIRNVLVKRTRKKRNSLCLADKLKVIELLKTGKSEQAVANQSEVSKSQVHNISVDREKMKQLSTDGSIPITSKRMKNEARYPEIDHAVLKWFNLMRNPAHRWKPLPFREPTFKSVPGSKLNYVE